MSATLSLILCLVLANGSHAKKRQPGSEPSTPTSAPIAQSDLSLPPPTNVPRREAPVASEAPNAAVAPHAPLTPLPAAPTPTAVAPMAAATPANAAQVTPPPENPIQKIAECSTGRTSSYRPSVFLLYNTATEVRFNNVTATYAGQGAGGNAIVQTSSTPGIGFELSDTKEHQFGWQAGLSYAFEKEIKALNLAIGGRSVSADYSGKSSPKLSVLEVSANILYRWTELYVPIGLNYIVPNLSNSSETIKGSFGGQFGLGFRATDHFTIELLDKMIAFSASEEAYGVRIDLGTGYQNGMQINLKYDF